MTPEISTSAYGRMGIMYSYPFEAMAMDEGELDILRRQALGDVQNTLCMMGCVFDNHTFVTGPIHQLQILSKRLGGFHAENGCTFVVQEIERLGILETWLHE